MNRMCWWFVEVLSRLLEPDERDAVRGDLAESGATGGQALRDLLGLVVRRQAALWKEWRPWLALLGLVGIAAVPLSETVFRINVALGQQLTTYLRYGVRFETGLTAGEDVIYLVCASVALVSWSWTSGFVLGSLSGRAAWLTGTLFYLVVLDSFHYRLLLSGNLRWNKPPFPLILLDAVVPHNAYAVLFLLAASLGVRRGLRLRSLGFRQALMLAFTVAVLTSLVAWTGGWYETARETWSGGVWHGTPWQTRLLPLVLVSWPVGYLLATASWSSRRNMPPEPENNR